MNTKNVHVLKLHNKRKCPLYKTQLDNLTLYQNHVYLLISFIIYNCRYWINKL